MTLPLCIFHPPMREEHATNSGMAYPSICIKDGAIQVWIFFSFHFRIFFSALKIWQASRREKQNENIPLFSQTINKKLKGNWDKEEMLAYLANYNVTGH